MKNKDKENQINRSNTNSKKKYTCPITEAEFVLIPAGTFMMGSPEDESERWDDETLHKVIISRSFYLQTTPVTQGQWIKVMGTNPSEHKHEDLPVETVSWNDAQQYIQKLNELSEGSHFRLPTEAEWEYACRAGKNGKYCFGNDESMLEKYAWYRANANETHPVGLKRPNDWGLYDMHGNINEWVQDWFGDYPIHSVTDPEGLPSSDLQRVLRGNCWLLSERFSRAASRNCAFPNNRVNCNGFRVAISLPDDNF